MKDEYVRIGRMKDGDQVWKIMAGKLVSFHYMAASYDILENFAVFISDETRVA